MTVLEIKDIEKEDTHIYYRQKYMAKAVYSILGTEKTGKIEFLIEHKPSGETDIEVKMIDSMDYPVLQLMIDLKKAVRNLIETNQLP